MSYAIGTMVYGINFKELEDHPDRFKATPDDVEALVDGDLLKTEYSGNGDAPRYLGVSIGSIDEATDFRLVDLIAEAKNATTDEVIAEFSQMKTQLLEDEDLSDGFKDHLKTLKAHTFVTWGSS